MKGGSNFFLKAAIVVVIVFSIGMIVQLQLEFNQMNTQRERLQEEIYYWNERIAELEHELSLPFDEDFVMRIARRRLGLRLPGEFIFINDLHD